MMSKLILGTAQIGMDYGVNNSLGKIRKEDAFKILNLAYQSGIEYLDTAPVYGDAQKIIGEFHKSNPSIIFKIISKIPLGYSIEKIEELVDIFRNEMHVDYISVLHFHSISDYSKINQRKLADLIEKLKSSKKVLSFGVSIYENEEFEKINNSKIDIIQLPFNLLDNINVRGDLLSRIKNEGKIIHSRSVFLQGLFFTDIQRISDPELQTNIINLNNICEQNCITMEELALQYCIAHDQIDYVLIGIDSIDQFKRNISIAQKKLQSKIIEKINDIYVLNLSSINPSKWKTE